MTNQIKKDVLGWRYEDGEPAFVELEGGFYLHVKEHRMIDKASFDAKLAAEGKAFAAGEVGVLTTDQLAIYGTLPGKATGTVAPGGQAPAGGQPPAGGQHPQVPAGTPSTAVTAGAPGSFDHDVPADFATLQGLGALGSTTAWTPGQYVALGDGSEVHWGGSAWVNGQAVAPTAALTTVVAGTGTAAATISVGGGPAPAAGTITCAVTMAGPLAITGIAPVTITAGMTAVQAAAAIAAAINGQEDNTQAASAQAVAAGDVVTIRESIGGVNVVTVTATVA